MDLISCSLPGSLDNNQVGHGGAAALAEALPLCLALETLQYARFCEQFPVVLPVANLRLRLHCLGRASLRLQQNQVDNGGADALATAIPACPTITTLKYGAHDATSIGQAQQTKTLKRCRYALCMMDFRGQLGEQPGERGECPTDRGPRRE